MPEQRPRRCEPGPAPLHAGPLSPRAAGAGAALRPYQSRPTPARRRQTKGRLVGRTSGQLLSREAASALLAPRRGKGDRRGGQPEGYRDADPLFPHGAQQRPATLRSPSA